jgi:hypothetical protein
MAPGSGRARHAPAGRRGRETWWRARLGAALAPAPVRPGAGTRATLGGSADLVLLHAERQRLQGEVSSAQEALAWLAVRKPVYTATTLATLGGGLAAALGDAMPPEARVASGFIAVLGAKHCYDNWRLGCSEVASELAQIGQRLLSAQSGLGDVERRIQTLR